MSSSKKLKMVTSNIEVAAGRPAAPDPEVRAVAKRRQFSAAYKPSMLAQAAELTESGAIGALLRRERLYSSHLATWRRERGIRTELAKRGTAHGSSLAKTRWVVERSIVWLHQFRRLRIRYQRQPSIHAAFLKLGCALICRHVLRA